MNFKKILLGVAVCNFGLGLFGQENVNNVDYTIQNHEIPSIQKVVVIDGFMNEPHWQDALKIDLKYETSPDENTQAKQKTTAYVYENGVNLYIAFRAEDTNADQIRAFVRDRDSAFQDDFVGVQFDTFNDEQRAYEFFVNARGSQMDLLFDESTGNEDDSWDAIWDTNASIDKEGYTVEMEIPFSNLRFASGDQIKTWSMEFLRIHPRNQRRIYRNSPRDRNRNCAICQFHKFNGFANARQGNQLELNPVLTIGKSESRSDETGQLESNGTDYEPGLNIRWGITPQATLDATINPDFSQVESDSAQLSVNQTFALFFNEKRPFFQEGSDYFNTDLRAIYTRNVTDPAYGAKLTGRQGNHTLGTFVARDEVTNIILPGTFGSDFTSLDEESNVLAARYRYDISPDLNIGALTTYRDADDYKNTVLGVDAFYRWNNKHRIRFQYLASDTDNSIAMQDDFDLAANQSGDAYRLRYNYNTRNTFIYSNYRNFDKDFRADLGFITQVNNDQYVFGGGKVFYSEDNWWNRIQVNGDWDITHDNEGRLLEKELEGRIEINGPLQSVINTGYVTRDRLFDDTLFAERFNFLFFRLSPKGGLTLGSEIFTGKTIDFSESKLADNFRVESFVNYDFNEHLSINVNHTYSNLESNEGRDLVANLTDARIKYRFITRSFLRFVLQRQDVEVKNLNPMALGEISRSERINKQLLYSYKLNPRTVFFLGYSDLADDDNPRNDLQVQQRGLFMKLGYVFDY